jgi:hypothetical protein
MSYEVGMIRRVIVLIAALAACDPAVSGRATRDAPPSKLEEHRTDVSGDRSGLSACLSTCNEGQDSQTDRATCRLNCETAFKVTPTPAVDDGVAQALRCMQGCRPGGERTAAAAGACRDACRTTAAAAPGAPSAAALERLGQCVGACADDTALSDTDRATCELTCAQDARRTAAAGAS